MPIKHGSTGVGAVYYGSTAIGRVYHGSTLVFDGAGAPVASSVWTLDSTYDAGTDPLAEKDIVFSQAWDELLIIVDGITISSGSLRGYCSTDGGSTFFSASTDYVPIDSNGFLGSPRQEFFYAAGTGGVIQNFTHIPNARGYDKLLFNAEDYAGSLGAFRGDKANGIDAIRINNTTASTMTAGKIYVYGRNAPWSELGSWTGGVDASASDLDFTGLAGYDELIMHVDGVGTDTIANRSVRYSDDNGTSFYSGSTDFRREFTLAGLKSDWQDAIITGNDSTAAKYMHHRLMTAAMQVKAGIGIGAREDNAARDPGMISTLTTDPIDALRLTTRGSQLMNSGEVRVYGRELPWTMIEARNCASSPAADQDFTDLDAYNELLVIMDGVGASGSSQRLMKLSVDNGSTFPTGGVGVYTNYSDGSYSSNDYCFALSSNSSAARYGILHIPSTAATLKPFLTAGGNARCGTFRSSSQVNALRVSSNNASINLNSGMIYVLGR